MSDAQGHVDVRGLTKSFGRNVAVQPLDVTIGPGKVTGLLGPNGSGKSTLLRMLVGLVRPDAGRCVVDGVELVGDGTAIRRRVTYAPGEIGMYGELAGLAHLRFLVGGRGRDALERSRAIAGDLGLPLEKKVRTYSHGMKRQLLVASALGPRASVRILDEPTEGLDPTKRSAILDLIHRESETGVTMLLSSHHLGEVERACDRVLFLQEGRLLDEEDAELLWRRARRTCHLRWDELPNPARLRASLEEIGIQDVRFREDGVRLLLPSEEPHRIIARLLELGTIPPPRSLRYGETSLVELYRELYGKEGV